MSVRNFLLRSLLLGCALLVAVALGEWWLRSRLFGNDPAYADWRDPDLYTWRYLVDKHMVRSDDHAKLAVRWGHAPMNGEHPHPLLGWCTGLDSATLLPPSFDANDPREAIVLVGWGWRRHHAGEALAHDTSLMRDHRVVDLSVEEFALDQDILLLEHTRDRIPKGVVYFWIDLDEMDRLHRTFMGRPKPWFTQGVYRGDLHGVPVPADPTTFLQQAPARPGSYLYHLVRTRVLNDTTMSNSAIEYHEHDLRELAKKILAPVLHHAEEHERPVVVLLEQATMGALADRRRWAVQDVCRDRRTPFHLLPARSDLRPREVAAIFVRERSSGAPSTTSNGLDSLLTALDRPPGSLSEVEQRMATMLKDAAWMTQVREKAMKEGVPVITMLERDARYLIEHEGGR